MAHQNKKSYSKWSLVFAGMFGFCFAACIDFPEAWQRFAASGVAILVAAWLFKRVESLGWKLVALFLIPAIFLGATYMDDMVTYLVNEKIGNPNILMNDTAYYYKESGKEGYSFLQKFINLPDNIRVNKGFVIAFNDLKTHYSIVFWAMVVLAVIFVLVVVSKLKGGNKQPAEA